MRARNFASGLEIRQKNQMNVYYKLRITCKASPSVLDLQKSQRRKNDWESGANQ